MENKLKIGLLTLMFLITNSFVYAQAIGSEATTIMNAMACLMCRIMQIIYFIIAFVATLMIIFAGIKWITSADDPSARAAAKTQVFHILIGLVIVLLAAYLVSFVVVAAFLGGRGMQILNPVDLLISGCEEICTIPT